jgi:aryl-alcohol dehydrogenase-like predicted oxidoreductase
MRKWKLPGTDLFISAIVMGTGNFCTQNENDALRLLDHYAGHDGNLLDTAGSFCRRQRGDTNQAEQIVGRWLKTSSQAGDMLISTKGGQSLPGAPDRGRIRREDLVADLDLSLQTLGRETIDLYYLQHDDPDQPVAELLGLLSDLRRQGKIRYYGLSDWSAPRLAAAIDLDRQEKEPGLIAVQNRWSLVRYNDQAASDPQMVAMDWQAYELFKQKQQAVLPYSSLGKGYFSKYLQNTCEISAKLRRDYENDLNRRRAEALRQLHRETDYSVSQLVLAWLLHQPMPVFPVVAFSRSEQLHDAVAAAGINLSYAMIEQLNAGEPW